MRKKELGSQDPWWETLFLPEKMSDPEKVSKQTGLSPVWVSKSAIYFIHVEIQNRDKFFVFTCRFCLVTITPSQSATLSFLILLMLDSSGFILWCGTRVSAFELRSMAVQLKVRQPTYNAVKRKINNANKWLNSVFWLQAIKGGKEMYVDRNTKQQKVHKMNDVWMSVQADLCWDNI